MAWDDAPPKKGEMKPGLLGRYLLALDETTADDRAEQGFRDIYNSEPVQRALDFETNLRRPYETALAAAKGDKKAFGELVDNSLALAMGTVDAPAKGAKRVAKAAKGARKAVKGALDMSEAARMKRAKDMGFDTERVWYHGTKGDIPEFDKSFTGLSTNADSAKKGFFFSSTPQTASGYAETAMPSRAAKEHAKSNSLLDDLLKYQEGLKAKYGPKWQKPNLATDAEMEVLDQKLKAFKEHAAIRDRAGGGMMGAVVPDDTPELQALKAKVDAFANSPSYPGKWTSKEADEAHAASVKYNDLYDQLMQKATDSARVQEATVLPVYARSKNPLVHDFKGEAYRDVTYSELIDKARAGGHDSLILKNTYDPAYKDVVSPTPEDILVVLDPSQIRSKFAKFDPKKAKSGNLSAGIAGAGVLGASALAARGSEAQAAPRWDEEPPKKGEIKPAPRWDEEPPPAQEEGDKTSAIESLSSHIVNAGTGGYLPQILAGPRKAFGLIADVAQGVPWDLAGGDDYTKLRDEEIQNLVTQEAEHPIASGLGTLGGAVGAGLATGGLLGAGKTVMGRLGKKVGAGALAGLLSNPGDEPGKMADGFQLGERLNRAKTGGLLGGLANMGTGSAALLSKAPGAVMGAMGRAAGGTVGGMVANAIQKMPAVVPVLNIFSNAAGAAARSSAPGAMAGFMMPPDNDPREP